MTTQIGAETYKSYMRSPHRSVKHSTYFDTYDALFERYRGKDITFVEIGILGGGSLFMWRDYFGPQARIIGVDLNPAAKKWEADGFEILIGSQSDVSFWEDFSKKVGPIDILLDDGGHTYVQQIITTECMLDNIKDGGMLVVEDTHTSYMRGFGRKRYSFMNYVKLTADRLHKRFRRFKTTNPDERIWSVQVFESIVAFHINRNASKLKSVPTENNGYDDQAEDFRIYDNAVYRANESLPKAMGFIRYLPFSKKLTRFFWKQITNSNSAKRSAKYFR
mgnify:CR=1 FL=1